MFYDCRVLKMSTNPTLLIIKRMFYFVVFYNTTYITEIENEKVNPSIDILYKLAEGLNVTINDIVYPQ